MRVISDDTLAVLNIWMEARGEPPEGKVAVAEVMRNRLRSGRWGKTMAQVILAPFQFSGWNTKDPNRTKAMLLDAEDPNFRECQTAWQKALDGSDTVSGAMHYFNPKVVKSPDWADPTKLVAQIGSHLFYKDIA